MLWVSVKEVSIEKVTFAQRQRPEGEFLTGNGLVVLVYQNKVWQFVFRNGFQMNTATLKIHSLLVIQLL